MNDQAPNSDNQIDPRTAFYKNAEPGSKGPLEGILVLEATNYGAGPLCGTVLADLGARSIKCERPDGGDPLRYLQPLIDDRNDAESSAWYLSFNRNKQCVTLNFADPRGQALFRELAAHADVIVENFTPDTMFGWGLGYDDIAAFNPGVVYVSVSGFGQYGPLRERKCFDPIAQAMCGVMQTTGEEGGPPLRAGFALADDMAGWQGAMGAMAALLRRGVTGRGQHVDVSLTDSLLYASDIGILGATRADFHWTRQGNGFVGSAPFNNYLCKDDHYVFINGVFEPMWKRLCKVMECDELIDDPRTHNIKARAENRVYVDDMVKRWTATRTADEVVTQLVDAQVAVGAVMDFEEIAAFPHFLQRDAVAEIEKPHPLHGHYSTFGVAPKFSVTPATLREPAPMLGQHNDDIYGDLLGKSEIELVSLKEQGVI